MKVVLTGRAEADLDSIRRWIAKDNPSRSISFTRELVAKTKRLSTWSDRFPEVDPKHRPGLRRLNHGDYRILYIVEDEIVSVIHIHHGRRATPEAF